MTKPYGYCYNCGSEVIRCIHDDCPKHCDLCKSNESLDRVYEKLDYDSNKDVFVSSSGQQVRIKVVD